MLENTIHLGDCLELMKEIPSNSMDLILCDLPYGTTQCKWDTVIPFRPLWEQYERIAKEDAAIVLTASQPFTSALVMSNVSHYRYRWVWDKVKPASGLNAKIAPLRVVEDICVFAKSGPRYNPQRFSKKHRAEAKNDSNGGAFGKSYPRFHDNQGLGFPKDLISISNANQTARIHPTQKPQELFEYLIKTYSNPGELVLDNCAGSGTTAMACKATGRRFICIEKDPVYWQKAVDRVTSWNG